MDDKEFLAELTQMVVRRATSMHLVDTMAFVSEVAERLEDDPVFGDFTQVEYTGADSKRRTCRIHGYTAIDESDGSLGLIIGKWSDSIDPSTISTHDIDQLIAWAENFAREAIEGRLDERIVEANAAFDVASTMRNARARISRVRIHVLSNQNLSQRYNRESRDSVAGVVTERHIWDLQRLKAIYQSSRERESVEINLSAFNSSGIRCILASEGANLKSYLCVIEGDLLADLFDRYGSRLLEGNVRSFLGMKGGVNKGIRSTIQDAPALFFAYNNGIAATAAAVAVESTHGRVSITGMTDLQIVNGGQTTASILKARKQDGLSLRGVTVQMKLTVVHSETATELIPRIAQFANTQNKVAIADFFANHPFHQKMEEISRRLVVPAKSGVRVQSKWFYERSRGQYQNERLYLSKAKKESFDLLYPSKQVVNKTELAKYDSTLGEKPHWVSLGAQKNFMKFASHFAPNSEDTSESEQWLAVSPMFGDAYYQRMVAMAIIWKSAEEVVSSGRGGWYEGDYRPQIVAYGLSLIFSTMRSNGLEPDLMKVWSQQDVDDDFRESIKCAAIKVQSLLLSPPEGFSNVGEWSKKDACWARIKECAFSLPVEMKSWSVERDDYYKQKSEARRQGIQDDSIAVQAEVFALAKSGYWPALLDWGREKCLLLEPDERLISKACTLQNLVKLVEKDWRKLLKVKQRCEEEGFRFRG